MKIINEKGKLFGLINIVDLLVLLFLVLVAGGVAWKIFGSQVEQLTAPATEVTYTVRIRGTFTRYYDALKSYGFPQQLTTADGPVNDAFITSAESVAYVTQAITDDGVIVDAIDPTKIDIICTITAKVNNASVLKLGTQELRVGKDHIVKTKYFEMNGNIESLTMKEE